jgi:triosephosphate isomerase
MHSHLRADLERRLSGAGHDVPILYGGSVNPGNAADLLRAPSVDGLLIGGASLDPVAFATICGLDA